MFKMDSFTTKQVSELEKLEKWGRLVLTEMFKRLKREGLNG